MILLTIFIMVKSGLMIRVFETLIVSDVFFFIVIGQCFFEINFKLIFTSSNRVADRNKAIYSVNRVMISNEYKDTYAGIPYFSRYSWIIFILSLFHTFCNRILNLINVIEKEK